MAPTATRPISRTGLWRAASVAADTCARIWRHPENRHRRVRTVGVYFVWQVWQRVVGRPWTITLVPSRRIRCYPHCVISSGTLYYRLPERGSMRFVLDYLRPGETMFDVGANVGTYALLASTVTDVSVVAFEPASTARSRAAVNVDLNGVSGQIRLVPYAVGRAGGTVGLSTGLGACNKVLPAAGPGDTGVETVEMVALDEFVASSPGPVHLLKIDVEGLELDVLEGARSLVERDRPALIVEANDPASLQAFLDGRGYRCFTYDPDARLLHETVPGAHLHRNVIALPDVDDAARRVAACR